MLIEYNDKATRECLQALNVQPEEQGKVDADIVDGPLTPQASSESPTRFEDETAAPISLSRLTHLQVSCIACSDMLLAQG